MPANPSYNAQTSTTTKKYQVSTGKKKSKGKVKPKSGEKKK